MTETEEIHGQYFSRDTVGYRPDVDVYVLASGFDVRLVNSDLLSVRTIRFEQAFQPMKPQPDHLVSPFGERLDLPARRPGSTETP